MPDSAFSLASSQCLKVRHGSFILLLSLTQHIGKIVLQSRCLSFLILRLRSQQFFHIYRLMSSIAFSDCFQLVLVTFLLTTKLLVERGGHVIVSKLLS